MSKDTISILVSLVGYDIGEQSLGNSWVLKGLSFFLLLVHLKTGCKETGPDLLILKRRLSLILGICPTGTLTLGNPFFLKYVMRVR